MAFENLKSTGIKYVLTKLKDYFVQIKDAVKSVNGEEPDETGDITLTTVPYAQNLESESSHRNAATFTQRTSGGDSSVSDGDAWLMVLKGNSEHTGYTAESISMTVTAVSDPPIEATIDRDTFVEAVSESGTTTLVYTSDWSANPATYGVTVTGEPASGDTITIVYVKEVRGTITVANPQKLIATGWNLYDHSAGYAKVVKYDFGYRIDGTYTGIKYSATPTGTQTDVAVNDGNFNITADGYIHVTGGNSTDTAIYPVWEDWTDGYTGDFEAYIESEVNLSTVMASYFPNGLLKAGNTVDELDLNLGQAISRVERLSYTAENLATAKASGREYEYDENYIYLARASAVASSVSVDGGYSVDDHGIEYFTGSDVDVYAEILYGNNLKNKLERDVLTISSQILTASQKAQVHTNIGLNIANNLTTSESGSVLDATQGKVLADKLGVLKVQDYGTATPSAPVQITVEDGAKGILYTIGSSDALCSEHILFTSSSGVTSARVVKTGSNVTVTTATNKFTITPSTGGTYVYVLWFA